jgi:hypothetical protein
MKVTCEGISVGILVGVLLTFIGSVWIWPVFDYYKYIHSDDGIRENGSAPPIKYLGDDNE